MQIFCRKRHVVGSDFDFDLKKTMDQDSLSLVHGCLTFTLLSLAVLIVSLVPPPPRLQEVALTVKSADSQQM